MINKERFENNLQLWGEKNPHGAVFVNFDSSDGLEFFLQGEEINIRQREGGCCLYSDDIELEMQQWVASLNLNRVEVLYVYGIGLGYSYLAIKDWLHLKPNHRLIYLEDDLRVVSLFLQTPLAEDFLKDSQARLYYWDWTLDNVSGVVNYISNAFLLQEYLFTSLKFYEAHKLVKYEEMQKIIAYGSEVKNHWYREYLTYGAGFLINFFRNSSHLADTHFAKAFYGKFKNVPAIICGAGPSLSKQIPLLKTLGNKGVIFAGGTAMNALNAQGVLPHFGIGVDPNIYQFTRIIANTAFETPFLYRNRLNAKALNHVSGPKFYIHGSGGYRLSEWLEEGLEIPESKNVDEGFNVINLSVSLALAFGCNPIIFIGVDLAYTEGRSYSEGLFQHALREGPYDFQTKTPTEELIERKDVNGNLTLTLWKWVSESNWFSDLARKNPQVNFINATEGGIGFTNVENIPLEDVEKMHLQHQEDLDGKIHQLIQQDQKPLITQQKILGLLSAFCDSLARCEGKLLAMRTEFTHHLQALSQDEKIPEESLERLQVLDQQFKEEIAYQYLISTFDESVGPAMEMKFSGEFERDQSEKEKRSRRIRLDFKKNTYLWESTVYALSLLRELLEEKNPSVDQVQQPSVENEQLSKELERQRKESARHDQYSYEDDRLIIHDEELDLHLDFILPPSKIQQNELKLQYFSNKNLIGPSTFYYNGKKISEAWFANGVRQGKSWFFYGDGSLHSIRKFKNGLLEGIQEYYYANGLLKSYLPYKNGRLNGDLRLFYPNGQLRRFISFVDGKREGKELYWSQEGKLLIEAHYRSDKPLGTAKEWYSNGNLAREVSYRDHDRSIEIKRWEEFSGAPIDTERLFPPDYFDLVSIHTNALTDSLENLYQQFAKFLPAVAENHSDEKHAEEYQNQLKVIAEQLHHLKNLQDAMNLEAGLQSDQSHEPLWKSSSARRDMEIMLKDLLKQMSGNIAHMQQILHKKFKPSQPSHDE